MSSFTPYTYIQCPCSETTPPPAHLLSEGIAPSSEDPADPSEDDRNFDPRAPRSNYSLYPAEHLLYCEDCQQIRCPRCVLDEIVTWFCPNCLFEVPSSTVKSEGNRCTRSCFQCPICVSPLSVSSMSSDSAAPTPEPGPRGGQYVLNCAYCMWSSKEINVFFEKPNGIFSQLAKIRNGGEVIVTAKERRKEAQDKKRDFSGMTNISDEQEPEESPKFGDVEGEDLNEILDAESQFENLKAFYQSQSADSSPASALGFPTPDYGYGSPGALSRIMGIYTNTTIKSSKRRYSTFREAANSTEGLQLTSLSSDTEIIQRLQYQGWNSTATSMQRSEFPNCTVGVRFLDDLRPSAYVLRTKRSKRCKTCRHILSKPESKVQNTRFRIRLVALNYIPSITIKALRVSSTSSYAFITPLRPVQFALTFKNPLFDSVKVTLATPAETPGRFASKVTILCPQFEIGANTDAWEEALRDGSDGKRNSSGEKRRTATERSEGQQQAEAGKVWERGRNWVSVVLEIVPASLRVQAPDFSKTKALTGDGAKIREDEDIVEIPVFVRVEWEADASHDDAGLGKPGGGEGREKRELAYWCVVGVGRIASD